MRGVARTVVIAILAGIMVLGTSWATVLLASATPGASVSVAPSTKTVNPGDSFDIKVVISTYIASRGGQVALSFNPRLLKVTGVTEGGFYKNWASAHSGSTIVLPQPIIDNGAGTVSTMGVAILGGDTSGPVGTGAFAIYHVTAKVGAHGRSVITLSDVQLGDASPFGNPIPGVVVNNGEVWVGQAPPSATATKTATSTSTATTETPTATSTPGSGSCTQWDVNLDGAVNTLDLILVGNHWAEQGAPGWIRADVVPDGVVNILDILAVSNHWGLKCPDSLTPTPTGTPPTATPTASSTPTAIGTPTSSATPTSTPAGTATRTPTSTATSTPTSTRTPTFTPTPSPTASPTSTSVATGHGSLAVSPGSLAVNPGDTFDVNLMVGSDVASRGGQVALTFDPAYLQVSGVSEGSFYKDWAGSHGGSTLVYPEPRVDNGAGQVSVMGVSILGGDRGGPIGNGVFATYHMTAKTGATGRAVINLIDVKLGDASPFAQDIPDVTVTGGEVVLGPATSTPTAVASGTPTETPPAASTVIPSATPTTAGVTATPTAPAAVAPPPSPTPPGPIYNNPVIPPTAQAAPPAGTPAAPQAQTATAASGSIAPAVGVTPTVALAGGQASGSPQGSPAAGGADALVAVATPATLDLARLVDAQGVVQQDVQYSVLDGMVTLGIGKGTRATGPDGRPVRTIEVERLDAQQNAAGSLSQRGSAYQMSPSGATFAPPITITISYDPKMIPAATKEVDLSLAYFDTKSGKWASINSKVDATKHEVSARVGHFTLFEVRAKVATPIRFWLIGGIVGLEVVGGAGAFAFIRRRKRLVGRRGVEIRGLLGPGETVIYLPAPAAPVAVPSGDMLAGTSILAATHVSQRWRPGPVMRPVE